MRTLIMGKVKQFYPLDKVNLKGITRDKEILYVRLVNKEDVIKNMYASHSRASKYIKH